MAITDIITSIQWWTDAYHKYNIPNSHFYLDSKTLLTKITAQSDTVVFGTNIQNE